jgi:hypothetical protein
MPHTPPSPRVRHPRQVIPQVSHLLKTDHRLAARTTHRGQSIKRSRDQAGFHHGPRSWDISNHMIDETVPAPFNG